MDGIFISYRRDDAAGYAGRLYDRLAAHFGPQRVFMDVEGIEPGTDFIDAIDRAVTSCRALIVMIGTDWLGASDAGGKRRLDDPMDFVRIETAMALKRNIRVVPVLLDGASMPRADQLPEDLVTLTRRQAIEVSHKQWEASTSELIRTLERIFTPAADDTPPLDATAPRDPAPADTDADRRRRRMRMALSGAGVAALAAGVVIYLAGPHPEAPAPTPASTPPSPPPAATAPPSAAPAAPAPAPVALPSTAPAAPAVAVPAPKARIGANVSRLDFGALDVGSGTRTRLRLVNEGDAAGKLAKPRIEGSHADSFTVTSSDCGANLAPAGRCDMTIAFKPSAAGQRSARLVIALDGGEVRVALSGSGVAPAPLATPAPAPVPAPRILTLTTRVDGPRHTLCYRVTDATAVSLSPRPGPLARADKDCVSVDVDRPATYTLTARNDTGMDRRSVALAPPELARPEPAPPAASAALPARGERWVYRTRGKWPTSPKRTVAFTVQSVGDGLVVEQLSQLEPEPRTDVQTTRSRAGTASFANWTSLGSEFAPWLAATEAWQGDASWNNVRTPAMGEWDDWYTRGEIKGREQVSVPAGSYSAWKAEVWSSRRATGSDTIAAVEPVRIQYQMWYEPRVKRYVKMVRKVTSANGSTIEEDVFELVAHRQP